MRNKIIYSIFIILLFWLIYSINKNTPIPYRWVPTFSESDKQPFGSYAFDKILEDSRPQEYTHTYWGISRLNMEKELEDNNLLIIANYLYLGDIEIEILLRYINSGGNAVLASNSFGYDLERKLKFVTNFSFYANIQSNLMQSEDYNTFYFCSEEREDEKYKIPTSIGNYYFEYYDVEEDIKDVEDFEDLKDFENNEDEVIIEEYDSIPDTIAVDSVFVVSFDEEDKVKSLRFVIGEGNLILVCNPAIFTNYGILGDSIQGYIRNHLAYLQDKPLIRTEYYEQGSQGGESQSEFRYILSEKPLKWAFYLTLISIIIFMIFTAKRKQKAIPVIKKPANILLQFVKSIASLYLQKNNNADLILKKKIYWGDTLKRKYGINIWIENPEREFYLRIADKTRQPINDIRRLFLDLNAIDENTYVSDEEMIDLITKMNNIK